MDDARFNVAVALTAVKHGAAVLNHATVTALIKEKVGKKGECAPTKITGVCVQDCLSDTTILVKTKCVINATGTFVDDIRKMNNRCADNMCTPSCGVHIVLPGVYCIISYLICIFFCHFVVLKQKINANVTVFLFMLLITIFFNILVACKKTYDKIFYFL